MGYKRYFVYIMTNRWNSVLYTGTTNTLERRVWEHKGGTCGGFTKRYTCDRLVYFEEYDEVDQAIAREKQIKAWSRAKKDALINAQNAERKDLAEDWYSGKSAGDPSLRSG